MSVEQWITLQSQLWDVFAPLLSWWLAFFGAGLIASASLVFAAIYFGDWVTGS